MRYALYHHVHHAYRQSSVVAQWYISCFPAIGFIQPHWNLDTTMASVLIVEDEDTVLAMVAELVEDLGHQPIRATNGREALEKLRTDSQLPALIISDVMMPRMSGAALVEAIRNDPLLRTLPIILMSAAGRPGDDRRADHFLPKPFDLDVLTALIERYISS
jgi:CheY-like chemotaxis protein